jgi:hypothetical protein
VPATALRLTACLLHYDPASCYSRARLSWCPAEPERKRVLKRGRVSTGVQTRSQGDLPMSRVKLG